MTDEFLLDDKRQALDSFASLDSSLLNGVVDLPNQLTTNHSNATMTKAQRSDSFGSLESDDDKLLKLVQEEESINTTVMGAMSALIAAPTPEKAREEAHNYIQHMDSRTVPYLVVELWLDMKKMLQEYKQLQTRQKLEPHGSPASPGNTRASEWRAGSKLGTVQLPSAQDIQLPAGDLEQDSRSSSSSVEAGGTNDDAAENWKAVLGDAAKTHQDLFAHLTAERICQSPARISESQEQKPDTHSESRQQLESDEDDAADVTSEAISYPLLTIHGDEQSPSHSRSPVHKRQLQRSNRPNSSHSPHRERSSVHQLQLQELMHKFNKHVGIEDVEGSFILPNQQLDPSVHGSQEMQDVLTSNEDLNEELKASLDRLTQIYGDDSINKQHYRFPDFGTIKRKKRYVDADGNFLEDDEDALYRHYLGADHETNPNFLPKSAGYTVLMPSVNDKISRPCRKSSSKTATANNSHAKKRSSRPTPTRAKGNNVAVTPQKSARRTSLTKDKPKSPLAQGPRRVVSHKQTKSTATKSKKSTAHRKSSVIKTPSRSKVVK